MSTTSAKPLRLSHDQDMSSHNGNPNNAVMDRPNQLQHQLSDGSMRGPQLKVLPTSRPGSTEPASSNPSNASVGNGVGPLRISTHNLNQLRIPKARLPLSDNESPDEPASVIHKPEGFDEFTSSTPSSALSDKPTPSPATSGSHPGEKKKGADKVRFHTHPESAVHDFNISPAPLGQGERRAVKSRVNTGLEDIQEQTDAEMDDTPSDRGPINTAVSHINQNHQDVDTLKVALAECWTLCNTLDSLSSIHRTRMFSSSSTSDVSEQAWKACWRLCKELYDGWNRGEASHVNPTMELCREFCKCLFGARKRGDEVSDSILRVSFELNNHLYNTTDRNLPNAFRERTLDFYLTMCHRMMKQHTSLPTDADALLRSCWSLAEMLFSLRQNLRDGKPPEEELLCSAVQSCWELCDMFRDGWTKVRPDRTTPRPVTRGNYDWSESTSNSTASSGYESPQSPTASGSSSAASGGMAANNMTITNMNMTTMNSINMSMGSQALNFVPDTPTTINPDEQSDSADDSLPGQILVLGHGRRMSDQSSFATSNSNNSRQLRPSQTGGPGGPGGGGVGTGPSVGSNTARQNSLRLNQPFGVARNGSIVGSAVSGPVMSASRSTASAPSRSQVPDMDDITLVKMLIVRAAFNAGYSKAQRSHASSMSSRTSMTEKTAGTAIHLTAMSLTAFVLTLPVGAFGMEPWQSKLLSNYKHAARSTQLFHNLPFDRRAYVTHVIRAVKTLSTKDASLNWLNALFEWVMGFPTNKALPVGLASAFISTVENECPPAG